MCQTQFDHYPLPLPYTSVFSNWFLSWYLLEPAVHFVGVYLLRLDYTHKSIYCHVQAVHTSDTRTAFLERKKRHEDDLLAHQEGPILFAQCPVSMHMSHVTDPGLRGGIAVNLYSGQNSFLFWIQIYNLLIEMIIFLLYACVLSLKPSLLCTCFA